nr:MAG TPA: hypothetical protein [Caudoviricetes sp.]
MLQYNKYASCLMQVLHLLEYYRSSITEYTLNP